MLLCNIFVANRDGNSVVHTSPQTFRHQLFSSCYQFYTCRSSPFILPTSLVQVLVSYEVVFQYCVGFILFCCACVYSENKFHSLFLDVFGLNTVYINHFHKLKLGASCFSFTQKIKRMTKIIIWASKLKTVSSIFP